MHPAHKVAGQDQQHGGAGTCQHEVNLHHPLRETTPLVRPCQEDGSGSHTQDLLYGELAEGSRHAGRPKLRFKDVCKRDMKRCNIDSNSWESIADDRPSWRQTVKQGAKFAEEALTTAALDKRSRRKERGKYPQQPTPFSCTRCGRDCHSRVGLHSHSRKCR